jgi:hypothetical protein
MLKGAHITLLIGPAVPVPAPRVVMEAVAEIEVSNGGTRAGFQVAFEAGRNSPLMAAMLPSGYLDPGIRVIIVATVQGLPNVLADGIITRQEITASNEPGQSRVTVTGEDLSVLMDIVNLPDMRYPAMPAPVIVLTILARYAAFGIVPLVVPPLFLDVPIPTDRIPTQSGTDLEYIRQLAEQNGHIFFIEPGPAPGMNLAYWGPDFRNPAPQPALTVNSDAATNVESLSFSLDGLAKKINVIYIFDPATQKVPIPIPLPNISLLRPPFGARLTAPMKVEFSRDTTKRGPVAAAALALARTAESSDAISANGQLSVTRYGRVLKARQVVGVRGAGLAYDGLYHVKSVRHTIKPGEYKQSFQLSRDGLVSITPQVVP